LSYELIICGWFLFGLAGCLGLLCHDQLKSFAQVLPQVLFVRVATEYICISVDICWNSVFDIGRQGETSSKMQQSWEVVLCVCCVCVVFVCALFIISTSQGSTIAAH
jgi:hypothetical protein